MCVTPQRRVFAFKKCLHRFCEECCKKLNYKCPLCNERDVPVYDHVMSEAIKVLLAQHSFKCGLCPMLLEEPELEAHERGGLCAGLRQMKVEAAAAAAQPRSRRAH